MSITKKLVLFWCIIVIVLAPTFSKNYTKTTSAANLGTSICKTYKYTNRLISMVSEPKKVKENSASSSTGGQKLVYLGEFTITAYCPCEKCCGKWSYNRHNGKIIGASGQELHYGEACATSSSIPFGTSIFIEGLTDNGVPSAILKSEDRVAKYIETRYNDKIIDVYFPNHDLVEKFGKIKRKVYIIE